jgi:hypothetical protein
MLACWPRSPPCVAVDASGLRDRHLGAGFGAHLGNNLTGFPADFASESYNSFALFNAKPLEGAGWTTLDAVLIAAIASSPVC